MGRKRQTFSKSLRVRVMLEVLQEICVCCIVTFQFDFRRQSQKIFIGMVGNDIKKSFTILNLRRNLGTVL